MSVIKTLTETKPRFTPLSGFVDGAGNVFLVYLEYSTLTNYMGWVRIVRRDTAGVVTDIATREPENMGKGDSVTILQSGAHILVFITVHISDPTTQLQALSPVLNACVPYPEGRPQLGMPWAYLGEEENVTIDYDLIARKVWDQAGPYGAARVDLLGNMLAKSKAAIEQMGVLREGTISGSASLYARLRDTVYEQLVKFLDPKP